MWSRSRKPISGFSPVAKSFEVFVNRRVVCHRGDPVLSWAMGNVVMESDANANIKPNKKKCSNKIDPAVSALMAFGTFQAEHEDFAFDMSDNHRARLAAFDGLLSFNLIHTFLRILSKLKDILRGLPCILNNITLDLKN